MTYVVSLEGVVPGARYDGTQWTQARIEEGATANGPWTVLETQSLAPLDSDPKDPQERNFTTGLATAPTGYFRVVFLDAAGHEQPTGAIYAGPGQFTARGELVSTLLEMVLEEVGFDATPEQALRWLNARHRKMVARSRCLRVTVQLGETAADQATYQVDPDIVELFELTVDGTPYVRIRRQDLIAARQSALTYDTSYGLFIADGDESGVEHVTLYPTPSAAGDAIEGFAAVLPPDLGLNDRVLVPVDFEDALVEGTVATGMARDTEQLAAADRFEARFDQAVEELRRRTARRFRGPGPAQIRVAGYNA